MVMAEDGDKQAAALGLEPVVYLPIIVSPPAPPVPCNDYFDDFSNPASGWHVHDGATALYEYRDGEYRILNRQYGAIFKTKAPIGPIENFSLEVDARWAGANTDGVYGLVFGYMDDSNPYYLFSVFPELSQFRLFRVEPSGWFNTIVDFTYSAAIQGGNGVNHLKVIRNGDQITLEINGANLGTWVDNSIVGPRLVGVGMAPYPQEPVPMYDARFDNFTVNCLP
jgi:hypothetical protein